MISTATFTWDELQQASGGKAASHFRGFELAALETDTRSLTPGCYFVPLSGENFDGNAYITQAYEKGASGAFISADYLATHPEMGRFPNLISVESPLVAYQALAQFHRLRMNAQIVAITGSSGKTTSKEMMARLLGAALGEDVVQFTEKNYNNDVGVALTLLSLKPQTKVMIVEMGMRGLGQISVLSKMAKPDIAVITNLGPAHIGMLGSMDQIAQAKCEIFEGLNEETGGLGIINGDDPLLVKFATQCWNGRLEAFSLHEVSDIHTFGPAGVTFDYESTTITVGVPGSHNVMNALAGIKTGEALGIKLSKMAEALAKFEAGSGRWETHNVDPQNNLWVINDAYNANPSSIKAAISAFLEASDASLKKVAVLGGMAELGDHSLQYHHELGEWLNSQTRLQAVILVGDDAKMIADTLDPAVLQIIAVHNNQEAVDQIRSQFSSQCILLLKASRAFKFENIQAALENKVSNPGNEVSHAAS